jgi:hypothetical protein
MENAKPSLHNEICQATRTVWEIVSVIFYSDLADDLSKNGLLARSPKTGDGDRKNGYPGRNSVYEDGGQLETPESLWGGVEH